MPPPGQVVVVGLGPGGADLVVPAARAALERVERRYVRTARHLAVEDLARAGLGFTSFDHLYDAAESLDEVYAKIVSTLLAEAGAHGEIAYAVPGNPTVAERSVALLLDAARRGEVEVELVPGLSFAELAWARLGLDPMVEGARVVDGATLGVADLDVGGALLIAQCDRRLVLTDVKLTLLERLTPDTPIAVLHHLGLGEESVTMIPLVELDRIEPDHLTSLFVATSRSGEVTELARLLELARRLRAPGGCPWDADQSHHSLTRYLLEEAYEVVDAVSHLPAAAPAGTTPDHPGYPLLLDELGDLLYQVVFHAVLAEETGAFGMGEVAAGIHTKLVRRHPHVFGDVDAMTSDDVMANWEQIKKAEKGVDSIVAGITPGLPSLLYAHKLYRKAASVGIEPGDAATARARIEAACVALADEGAGQAGAEHALAEVLAGAVALARALGVDAESALRAWAEGFRARLEATERAAAARGLDLVALDPAGVAELWAETAP